MTDFYQLSDEQQVARLTDLATEALSRWEGKFLPPRLVKFRENAVFETRRDDGMRLALRVHRHAYHSDIALLSELQWMSSLADAGIPVPPIIPGADGGLFQRVRAGSVPEERQVDLLGWLSGTPIGSSEEGLVDVCDDGGVSVFFEIGRLAGRMHNQTCCMELPATFSRHSWCDEGLLGENPLWGRFWALPLLSLEQRGLLLQARAMAREDLVRLGKPADRFGMIHADLVPENLLSDAGRLQLIDFDDSGFGWHLFELATALYFVLDEPAFPALRSALIAGYRAERSLSSADEALLPLFMFLRGTTYLGWVQTRPETKTAKELGPLLVERTCRLAEAYLAGRVLA